MKVDVFFYYKKEKLFIKYIKSLEIVKNITKNEFSSEFI